MFGSGHSTSSMVSHFTPKLLVQGTGLLSPKLIIGRIKISTTSKLACIHPWHASDEALRNK